MSELISARVSLLNYKAFKSYCVIHFCGEQSVGRLSLQLFLVRFKIYQYEVMKYILSHLFTGVVHF